jgi:hypothetical protein
MTGELITRLQTAAEVAPPSFSSSEATRLTAEALFDDHLGPLARRMAARGDIGGVEALGTGSRVLAEADELAWTVEGLHFAIRTARLLVRPDAGPALCTLIDVIAHYGTRAGPRPHGGWKEISDEASRGLGYVGQVLPATFRSPASPAEPLVPNALQYDVVDPIAHLYEAFQRLKDDTIKSPGSTIYPLIWRDAVAVTIDALLDRERLAYGDGRLEHDVLNGLFLLSELGSEAARIGNGDHATIVAYELGQLAEDAAGFVGFREYAEDITIRLVDIGIFAVEHSLRTFDGRELADWIAETLATKLGPYLRHAMHQALVAGRFGPASHDSRMALIRMVAGYAGGSFGMNLTRP